MFVKELEILILSFFIYSFCGWIWESIILPVARRKKLINSGFLTGPWIPIYGFGAIIVILFFEVRNVDYPIQSLFFMSGTLACTLEYITSWVMEKIYHRRWWDYSQAPFNINGRVCLSGFIAFGLFSVVAVKFGQPYLDTQLAKLSNDSALIISTALVVLFLVDFIQTINLASKLENVIEELQEKIEVEIENIKSINERNEKIRKKILKQKGSYRSRRLLAAFPDLFKKKDKK